MHEYPDDYLHDRLRGKLRLVTCAGVVLDDPKLTVRAQPVDLARIERELTENYAKKGTMREVQLITGQYRPRMPCSHSILGRLESPAEAILGSADYWAEIHYACAAFWVCDASAEVEKRARDIRGHLAKAVRQLQGSTRSSIHVGIETHDAVVVEDERLNRILRTVSNLDGAGTKLDWIFCHLMSPESPPDNMWEFGETTVQRQQRAGEPPLSAPLLVVPGGNGTGDGVHWR
jgi:hypothetical protein